MLVPEQSVRSPWDIPASWLDYYRGDVGSETKRNAVKTGVEKWCERERKTKRLYETCYRDLCDMDEIAAACKVKRLVEDSDTFS